MAKAMLIIDMPKACYECPFAYITLRERECLIEDMDIDVDVKSKKPTWCPLREVPQKKDINEAILVSERGYVEGYNACIDEILGGGE